jgi:hypothetical protein
MEILEKEEYRTKVLIKGGTRCPEFCEAYINGSTWGTSMLKMNHIGREMYMEVKLPHKVFITSRIKEVTIVGDDWKYRMEWEDS